MAEYVNLSNKPKHYFLADASYKLYGLNDAKHIVPRTVIFTALRWTYYEIDKGFSLFSQCTYNERKANVKRNIFFFFLGGWVVLTVGIRVFIYLLWFVDSFPGVYDWLMHVFYFFFYGLSIYLLLQYVSFGKLHCQVRMECLYTASHESIFQEISFMLRVSMRAWPLSLAHHVAYYSHFLFLFLLHFASWERSQDVMNHLGNCKR